ncbi:MAG: DUF1295 domain-containing protein [Vicinamibacterales bacterium]
MIGLAATAAGAALGVMVLLWLLGLKIRNFSYVDLGWAANFTLIAVLVFVSGHGVAVRMAAICLMFALWSSRLALHLATRIVGQPEEGRYVKLRSEWGASGNLDLKFLAFFLFQGVLDIVLALPILVAAGNPRESLQILEWVGVVWWAVAWIGESIADHQLKRFKSDPANKGKVCDVGLWSLSRHPNYFFEWQIWIGYALFALASPWGWICLALPALMLHFLLNVTGVKPTEEQALRSKGDLYRDYQRRVNAFVPWSRSSGE